MKKQFSLKLLYLLTKISFWGLLALIVVVLFAGVVMITLDSQSMKLGFPSDLYSTQEVTYLENVPGNPVEVEFSAYEIRVPVKYMDTPTKFYVLSTALVWLLCVLLITRYFKRFMKQVIDGLTFKLESINFIKKAAIALIILEAIELTSYIIGYLYVRQKFSLGDLTHEFSWSFPSMNLILALTLWTLAHIFQKGKELEDEQKLTV